MEPKAPIASARVRETLERILASPAFRKSEQCQKFLRYVVEHSHEGRDDLLKERTIGVDVFGRAPDYDTANDPTVRVRATEVRKRLSQYYGETPNETDVRIEIPSGSYRVEFHAPHALEPAAAAAVAAKAVRLWPRFALAGGLFAILGGAVAVFQVTRPPVTDLDRFWAPVFESGRPVLLYCGQPVVYFLSREVRERYRQKLTEEQQRGSYPVVLDPGATVRGKDIIPVTDQFVGIGNSHTAAMVSVLLAHRQKAVEIRYANDLSFSDLRSSPSVLIGAFSNLWTLEMQRQLRFVFEQEGGVRRIRDKSDGKTWQLAEQAPDGKTPEDYAIVSRLFNSGTGQILITAAGIAQYGTRAAGEFLTGPKLLAETVAKAPADWPRKNLQVLLRTAVYRGTPATPTVVVSHVW